MATEEGQRLHPGRGCLVLGVTLLLALCMVGSGLALAAQVWLPQSNLPEAYLTQACAGVRVTSRAQVGVWWISPYLARLRPLVSRRAVCGYLPWSPLLRPRGKWVFPP